MRSSAIIAGGLSLGYASALSSGCTAEVAVLALGNLGQCLQLTSLLPILSTSGSIITPLNTYLGSLCASSTTTCSNSTLTSAISSVQSSCSSDLSGGGTDAAEITGLLTILQDYPEVQAAGCAKNSTTGGYCVTETLTTIQSASGSNLTTAFLTSLLSGSSSAASDGINSALSSGSLCTGCVQTIYQQALKANSSIASTSIAQSLTSKCGSSFGSSSASGVATTATSAATSAAATSSKASSAMTIQPLSGMGGMVLAAAGVMGSIALGAVAAF